VGTLAAKTTLGFANLILLLAIALFVPAWTLRFWQAWLPLHVWGACGVGKSQIVAQVATDLNWQFLDIRAVQLDPVDLRGLPRISADQAE
jgi:hypothetical protein